MGWRIPKVITEGKIPHQMQLPYRKLKLYDDCLMYQDETIELEDVKDVYFYPHRVIRGWADYEPVLYITLKSGRKLDFRGWKMRHEDEYRKIAEFLVDFIESNR
ncbi:hypothetical protein PH210_06105 [Paenibacillus sp. BSR1-1]|uniref:hypothetical protein n=1 Tax=Paenibacillus sp. BSR1-1 TaxID=3020845 RepID=UPI0025AFFECE|nr:hypothetical protein [Paenibacillus sp. BSR1-1]MDN3015778.1 hypothetical protein [Paenibacillus sp. BSR1-1]